MHPGVWRCIQDLLRQCWSPEQDEGRLNHRSRKVLGCRASFKAFHEGAVLALIRLTGWSCSAPATGWVHTPAGSASSLVLPNRINYDAGKPGLSLRNGAGVLMMVKIAIAGAVGKMGQSITRELSDDSGCELVGALEHPDSPFIGKSLGDIAVTPSITVPIQAGEITSPFDVMVDFTRPEGLEPHLDLCMSSDSAILIGTTGLESTHRALIDDASTKIPVLCAANTSIGVNLCVVLVEMASRALGKIFDIEVIEAHHREKIDAPSGTALYLGEAASKGSGLSFPDCGVFVREGKTGKRVPGTIGFSTIRGGDIAGEHTVLFIGDKERIEITHRATDRVIFAKGAIQAAKWLAGRKPGLYAMKDVLEIGGAAREIVQ